MNWVTLLIVAVVLHAAVSGLLKGASRSVRELYVLIFSGLSMLVSIYLAWQIADWLAPLVRDGLTRFDLPVPPVDAGTFERTWKLLLQAVRDFGLLRFGLLFFIIYLLIDRPIRRLALWAVRYLPFQREQEQSAGSDDEDDDDDEEDDEQDEDEETDGQQLKRPRRRSTRNFNFMRWLHSLAGGFVGLIIGGWRGLVIITVLFVTLVLFPTAPFVHYVQQSAAYQLGAGQIIAPFSGDFIENKVPVWTEQLEGQLQELFTQKYAWMDADIPADLASAAAVITERYETTDEQAEALYRWVGSRISYDWEKVRRYEEDGTWLEQTPEDTFRTRKGVCIDYARLYAVMARAVELEVRIVTGLGYDGRGGYGPHAWNEVRLADGQWVPLDATWHSSGKNWFNPPDFEETHVRREVL